MPSERERVLRSSYRDFVETNDRQNETQLHLNDKAVEIIKVNLLVGSIAASIITFRPENISLLYFSVGGVTLALSILYCARVYSPTNTYHIGIGEDALDKMLSQADAEKHFEKLAKSYSKNVEEFDDEYAKEASHFTIGLWTAIATVLYLIVGAASTVIRITQSIQYPLYVDVVVIIVIAVFIVYFQRTTSHEKD